MRNTGWADGCRRVNLQRLVSLLALTAQHTYTVRLSCHVRRYRLSVADQACTTLKPLSVCLTQYGIGARPARASSIPASSSRVSPLLSMRSPGPQKFGVSMSGARNTPPPSYSSYSSFPYMSPGSNSNGSNNGSSGGASGSGSGFPGSGERMQLGTPTQSTSYAMPPVRPNPFRLFIREPPPSVEAGMIANMFTPSRPASGPSGEQAGAEHDNSNNTP